MNTDAGLLRAIMDDPADDTARLVYADWLEEHDEEARAGCIREQIEAARQTCLSKIARPPFAYHTSTKYCNDYTQCPHCQPYRKSVLWLRGYPLKEDRADLMANGRFWGGPVLRELSNTWYEYYRGFVRSIMTRWEHWLAQGPAIVLEQPVELVRIEHCEPYFRREAFGNLPGYEWQRQHAHGHDTASRVPVDIWDLLECDVVEGNIKRWREHTGVDIVFQPASMALHKACVRWARIKAGLEAAP